MVRAGALPLLSCGCASGGNRCCLGSKGSGDGTAAAEAAAGSCTPQKRDCWGSEGGHGCYQRIGFVLEMSTLLDSSG